MEFKILDRNNTLIQVDDQWYVYNAPSAGIYAAGSDEEAVMENLNGLAVELPDLQIKNIVEHNRNKRIGLHTLSLILTSACNLKCRYCYESPHTFRGPAMSEELALRAVEILVEQARRDGGNKHINFFGGEPLLNYPVMEKVIDRVEKIRAAEGLNIQLSVTTNFILMTDTIFDRINRANIITLISIDGTKAAHDSQRIFPDGSGSYDILTEKIRKYGSLRPDLLRARATVVPGNMDISSSVEHIRSLGFKVVYFSIEDCFSKHKRFDEIPKMLDQYDRGYGEYMKGVFEEILAGEKGLAFVFYDLLDALSRRTLHFVPCHMGSGYAALGPDGFVYACQRLFGCPGVSRYPLEELTRLPELFYVRTVFEKESCPDCWARYLCAGACPAQAVESYGHDRRPDPWRCMVRKIEVKWLLWLFIGLLKKKVDVQEINRI